MCWHEVPGLDILSGSEPQYHWWCRPWEAKAVAHWLNGSNWVPDTHVEDSDWVASLHLLAWPNPGCYRHWCSEPVDRSSLSSFSQVNMTWAGLCQKIPRWLIYARSSSDQRFTADVNFYVPQVTRQDYFWAFSLSTHPYLTASWTSHICRGNISHLGWIKDKIIK